VCTLAVKKKIRVGFDMSDRTIPLQVFLALYSFHVFIRPANHSSSRFLGTAKDTSGEPCNLVTEPESRAGFHQARQMLAVICMQIQHISNITLVFGLCFMQYHVPFDSMYLDPTPYVRHQIVSGGEVSVIYLEVILVT
jgi:hypothetical protein